MKKIIEKESKNSKKLWDFINKKLGKKQKSNEKIKYLYDQNKCKITEPAAMANVMNEFLANIGTELTSSIIHPPGSRLKLPTRNCKTIFLYPTSRSEVVNIISQLKVKSGGVDKIHTKTLLVLLPCITDPLVHIINLSIEKSIWPDKLKCAEIRPVHKSKEKSNPSNYRPISLISNIAKIFETIIYNRLLNFITNSNILSNKQFGFMKKLGTKDALNYVTNILYEKMDNSTPIAIAFLDLAKAFDCVNHEILLEKLSRYGIRGSAHKLLTSYLNNRYQRVKVNDSVSDFTLVKLGVPQGSILGPFLFIIYINDLLKSLPENVIISFADDTVVLAFDKLWSEVERKLNSSLETISTWLACNKLVLNTDKTVFMTFGNYCNSVPGENEIIVKVKNKIIERVEVCRYLGIYIDYRLTWKAHIEYIISKSKYLIFLFYKLSQIMNTETMRIIYYALFHSLATYGIIAWGGAYTTNLSLLQNIQNRILKIVNKNKFVVSNNPLNLSQTFSYEALRYHFSTLKNLFVHSNSITRNKSIQLPNRKRNISSKNSYIKAIQLFNTLPNELKTLISPASITKQLKKWIKMQPI